MPMKSRIPVVAGIAASSLLVSCEFRLGSTLSASEQSQVSGSSRSVAAKGEVFSMGSSDAQASPDERSGWTRFGHDYWLDTVEMPQSEYQALTGRNPSMPVGADLPATNVSWFDAVVAANARSRRDGFDSVYEYASVQSDSTGGVVGLAGLSIHLDRSGWRLPTEAEWEFAARAGTTTPYPWGSLADSAKAAAHAWYQGNAAGGAHPVGRLAANGWGFHDMSGNVMEWVGDWKGPFPKDTIEDYAGLETPADVAEIPLKGGAFPYGLSHLRPSSRSATYAAYRSSRAEYVGFRLARGGFAARYLSSSGQTVWTPPVTLLRSDVAKLVEARGARLVFVNRANGKGTLSWVDYAESNPVVRSLPDKDPVFHPSISPDGRWVAWCTTLEGSSEVGRIKARRLAVGDTQVVDLGEGAIPRWWANGADTFLVRGSDAFDNTFSGWNLGRTTARRWSGGGLTGTVETWSSSGSFHDGRSGGFLYTGYRRLKQLEIGTGTVRTLFSHPRNGKSEGDTSQVCNVSSAPDGSGRVMFLDFGYPRTSTLVGRPYGIHEIAFVSDSLGNVVQQLPSPSGERQWEHMEWSNQPTWAVSGSIDAAGAYRHLYLVDVRTGVSTRIVEASSSDLWQPALWVGGAIPVGNVVRDSLFQYGYPENAADNIELLARLPLFWIQHQDVEAVALGSSHTSNGILPSEFGSVRMLNLAFAGSRLPDQRDALLTYVLPHAPKLKWVVLSLMPGWLFGQGWTTSWDKTMLSKGAIHDRAHGGWPDSLPAGWSGQAKDLFDSYLLGGLFDSLGGYLGNKTANGWGRERPEMQDQSEGRDSTDPTLVRSLDSLRSLAQILSARGVKTILVAFPQSPGYRNTPLSGRYGPSWATYGAIKAVISGWNIPGFHFYDAHLDGLHDYTDAEAQNWDHLNEIGARKISRRIDSLMGVW